MCRILKIINLKSRITIYMEGFSLDTNYFIRL